MEVRTFDSYHLTRYNLVSSREKTPVANADERYAFWDSHNTIEWFKSHGYTLYQRVTDGLHRPGCTTPTFPSEPFVDAEYPHAFHDNESFERPDGHMRPLLAFDEGGKVVFAQDSKGRHFAIKLVRAGTDEYRVLEFLSRQKPEVLRENCVVPVLDFLRIEGFYFVVMPRWGSYIYLPRLQQLHDVTTIMHSMLKGLAFLHEHNIAHGDIVMANVLVNHVSDMEGFLFEHHIRQDLRSKNRLLYAVYDFDFSTFLAPGIRKEDFRLPYQRSWGTFDLSNDTAAGEFDYNPFVFDVGTMSVQFCHFFQHLTTRFYMLAPLLDMMTTRDLDRRFTASEALQFFEEGLSALPAEELDLEIGGKSSSYYEEYDRWQGLPPDFVEKWKAYKETPIPWTTKLLRDLCARSYWCHIVPWTRWFFFRVFSFPRTLCRWFIPSKLTI